MKIVKVLFVCMGNICRSPTAQGVFEHLVSRQQLADFIYVDSAGSHDYHLGEAPDKRSQAAAKQRGIDLSSQRARRISADDFERFDYILAMDRANLAELMRIAKPKQQARVQLFMHYASRWQIDEVPDPYYGGSSGFDRVLDMVEDAAEGLLEHIRRSHS